MQNKVIQTSNTKSKKEKEASKKGTVLINSIFANDIELSKHKSHDIYEQYSPSNLPKNNNNVNSSSNNNNPKKNNTLVNTIKKIIHYSGAKKSITQNIPINNPKSKSKKEYGNININDINTQTISININSNNKNNNLSENKNEIRKSKKHNLDNILSESDSYQEIDSMEEESLTKGIKSVNMNLKGIHNMKSDSLNYKRHLTTGISNPNTKNNELFSIKDTKQSPVAQKNKNKISNKKKTKKLNINDDNEETDDEVIINDNEFDNTHFIPNDKLNETKFPKLSSNPFIGPSNNNTTKPIEYKKSISSKEYGPKHKKAERLTISSHHIKSTTLGTIIQTNTNHNSSNLSNTIDLVNINLNNNTDDLYKNFLLTSKKGDKDKFLELLEQVSSLPKNIRNINYQDENGFSALHYSCDEGNLKIVETLLKANCELNIRNNENKTPLHLSSIRGFFDISKKLIEAGALLNIFDSEKNSPLHYASMHNHIEILKYFLTKLPQGDIKNIYGKRPIDLTNNKEIKETLDEYMKKNANSYHKIKIYETTDEKMKNLIEKQKNGESPSRGMKRINTSSKKSKNSSLSPNSKKNGKKNKIKIRTQDYNSVQNETNIKKKNTINVELKKSNYINIENDNDIKGIIITNNTDSKGKVSPKHINNKNNTNTIFKTSELKSSTKSKDNVITTSQKIKKENNINNNKKSRKVNIQDGKSNNNTIKIKHITSNYNNTLDNNSNNLNNALKKTRTVEQFSNPKSKNLLYQSNRRTEVSNDSKLNNSKMGIININNSINNELNRINISFDSKTKEMTKLNKSKNKQNKADNLNNNSPENKSKIGNNAIKHKQTNIINLNQTYETINNTSKISKKYLKNSTSIKTDKSKEKLNKKNGNNNNNIQMVDNKDKKLSSSKNKNNNNKQKQKIQEIKLEHTSKNPSLIPIIQNQINLQLEKSYTNPSPTNYNTSKISTKNKNRINFETLDKNKIVDQTLPDNVHAQLNLNSIEEERVTPSSFICLAQLGKGSFGEVYLVQKINTKEKFAMKVLRKERIMGQNLLKYAIAERNVLSLSNHPFIVKLNFAFQTSSKLFLILEYCCNGDLAKHLLFEKRFSESRAKFYICEVLLALENLHQRDIIFRDLKPDNVVLDAEGHCKLTDFGLSKEGVTENQSASSFCGSIAYLAPEMLKKQGHGKAVDWYLLGVLLYEMLVGITPFFTNRKEDIFHNIEFEELKIPEFINKDTASLLRGLLQKDPWKRLGGSNRDAEEIKEHPYFKDVNWDDVYNKRITPPPINFFSNNIMHVYQRPRLFNDDSANRSSDKTNPNMLPGWSFINNDE